MPVNFWSPTTHVCSVSGVISDLTTAWKYFQGSHVLWLAVALVLQKNAAVEMKTRPEWEWCRPVRHTGDSQVGQEEGCSLNQILPLEHNILHTWICMLRCTAVTQDVVENADACINVLPLLTATWRLPSGWWHWPWLVASSSDYRLWFWLCGMPVNFCLNKFVSLNCCTLTS